MSTLFVVKRKTKTFLRLLKHARWGDLFASALQSAKKFAKNPTLRARAKVTEFDFSPTNAARAVGIIQTITNEKIHVVLNYTEYFYKKHQKIIDEKVKALASDAVRIALHIASKNTSSTNETSAPIGRDGYLLVCDLNCIPRDDFIAKFVQFRKLLVVTEGACSVLTSNITLRSSMSASLLKPEVTSLHECSENPVLGVIFIKAACLGETDRQTMGDLAKNYLPFRVFLDLQRAGFQDITVQNILGNLVAMYVSAKSAKQIVTNVTGFSPAEAAALKGQFQPGVKVALCPRLNRFHIKPSDPLSLKGSRIHVIIPYHNQFDLTIKCIAALRKSAPDAWVTAINNRSDDSPSNARIALHADELLTADFPFNYSKINNFAVSTSKFSGQADYLFFLNNDVILKNNTVSEMFNWFSLNDVGAVGARLFYPDGRVQHGGVRITRNGLTRSPAWAHVDQMLTRDEAAQSAVNTFSFGVTAACMLVRKTVFDEIGGFDQEAYPIGFSDAELFVKIREKGHRVVYSADAEAVHHESVSRGISYPDDCEALLLARELNVRHVSNNSREIVFH